MFDSSRVPCGVPRNWRLLETRSNLSEVANRISDVEGHAVFLYIYMNEAKRENGEFQQISFSAWQDVTDELDKKKSPTLTPRTSVIDTKG